MTLPPSRADSNGLWEDVQRNAKATRCKCTLRPAMKHDELVALGGGCKMPDYCCSTLDLYRRRVAKNPETG